VSRQPSRWLDSLRAQVNKDVYPAQHIEGERIVTAGALAVAFALVLTIPQLVPAPMNAGWMSVAFIGAYFALVPLVTLQILYGLEQTRRFRPRWVDSLMNVLFAVGGGFAGIALVGMLTYYSQTAGLVFAGATAVAGLIIAVVTRLWRSTPDDTQPLPRPQKKPARKQ
jgi:hypothetical protein